MNGLILLQEKHIKTFYYKLSECLKYTHEDFHAILPTMNYHDWAGDEHADHTKRLIFADAYQQMKSDQGEPDEVGAALLRDHDQPVIWHQGRIEVALPRIVHVSSSNWSPNITSKNPQDIIDQLHHRISHVELNPDRLVYPHYQIPPKNPVWDKEGRGYLHHEASDPDSISTWHVNKHILVPAKHINSRHINLRTGELS